jgi:hypothetical protein
MFLKTAALALLGAVLLTGCTSNGTYSDYGSGSEFTDESAGAASLYSADNPGAGITGEALPAYYYFGRSLLSEGDVGMYVACQYMRAYETGVVVREGEDVEPEAKVLKEHFRTYVIFNLGLISESYPEAAIYEQGALEKLADSTLEPEGYLSFQRSCEPYLALLDRMDQIASEEVKLFGSGCWNRSDTQHKLYVKLDGEWESLGQYAASEDPERCTDPDYPYVPTASVQMYGQSWEFRWVNLPAEQYDSFSDGSVKIIDYFTADPTGYISNTNQVRE